MRLTLRTLLAYLDDTLDPAQTRLIGQKVAESDTAQELIARIKLVTRRRRLTMPPTTGPGADLDTNTVAEYLDNVLPGDQLAEVEETCLNSDFHLAEIAACHQILTLVLGEPMLVPPVARQRMYQLIQGREAIHHRRAPRLAPAKSSLSTGPAPYDEEADETLLLGLPLYQRMGAGSRWMVPAAGAALFVGLVIAFWMVLPRSGPGPQQVAQRGEATQDKTPVDKTPEKNVPDKTAAAKSTEKSAEPAGQPNNPPPPDPTPVVDKPAPPPTPEPAPPVVDKTPPAKPVDNRPSTDRRALGRYVFPMGAPANVLVTWALDRNQWQRVRPNNPVFSTDVLVSLPGYRSELNLESGVNLILWGTLPEFSPRIPVVESVVILHANPAFDLDFTLDHGRVLLSHRKPEGPARVRVRFHNEIWDLTLQDNNTEVAVELLGLCLPWTREPGAEVPPASLALLALRGQTNVKVQYQEFSLPPPSMARWENSGATPTHPERLPRLPDWYASRVPPQTRDAKEMQMALDELSKMLSSRAVDVGLTEALKESDPYHRRLAIRCLGALGDLSKLVAALGNDRQLDMRLAAIETLRHWLGLRAGQDQRLAEVLVNQKQYTPGQAETVLQLLHGFSAEQWRDLTTRATLVEYLNHDKLAIRQCAHALLTSLAPEGQKIPYDPAGQPEQRHFGYQQWKKLINDPKLFSRPGR